MNLARWTSRQRRPQNQHSHGGSGSKASRAGNCLPLVSLCGAARSGSPAIPILEIVVEFRGGNFSPNSCPRSAAHLAK